MPIRYKAVLFSLAVAATSVIVHSCYVREAEDKERADQKLEKRLPFKLCELSQSKANPAVNQSGSILANFIKKFPEVAVNKKAEITYFPKGFGWITPLKMTPASPGGHNLYHVNSQCYMVDITRGA